MNLDRYTQKSLAAIQAAQACAQEYGNQTVEQAHLLYALLGDAEGLVPQLLTAMGLDARSVAQEVEAALGRLPKVSGYGREAGKLYVSQGVDAALRSAE
ncbi:MAG: type VI secretion system ATPase TssH, partial [Oscillospiraceae bacterium]|nr:type VI secretion system ATPase TssH [Oscillospiraceae bacterium]